MKMHAFVVCLFAILVFITTPASMFAQNIDISGMDNDQLMSLLQEVLSKLQADEETKDTVTETPAPAAEPAPLSAAGKDKITVYINKKLIIEALPGYMFILSKPEEKNSEPDPGDPLKKRDNSRDHYDGEPCTPDGATWGYFQGEWYCRYG